MRFAAGITLYHPTQEMIENIKQYGNSFDIIVIFDNTESRYKCSEYFFGKNFILISAEKNMGLPTAYNQIIEMLKDYNIDYLCTLDQDSLFKNQDIEAIKKIICNNDQAKNWGIIAPYIDYGYKTYSKEEKVEKKPWLITSGSFINYKMILENSLEYDEKYFIDKFEIDFCQQVLQKGYDLIMYYGAVLHQELGEKSGHQHPNHSSLRHYYLFRNRFYYNKKWYSGIRGLMLDLCQTIRHLIPLYHFLL